MEEKKNPNDVVEEFENEELEEVVEEAEETEGEVIEETKEEDVPSDQKLAEMTDKCQRIAAEYYNYRERTTKEKANMYNDGVRDTIDKLLPVIDNFERAMSVKTDTADENFVKGVEMILKQFKEIMTAMGVEEIPAQGEKFDPNLHSAVSHIEDENFGENEISIVMMKGYTLKGKVIRHSMVQVAN